jgi:peptidoglycan/LPS O-acetylase OafA/YrhL
MQVELRQRLSKGYIPALDGIRGISALMVFGAHVGIMPRQWGALGVAIFFVLSGFLITWLLMKENESTGTVSLRGFYIRRTLRIFPAFYVFWVFCIAAAVFTGHPVNRLETAASFFYCGDYYLGLRPILPAGPFGIMSITWSLGVEEKFYLVWPWVFVKYRNQLPKLLKFVIAGMGLIWVYRIGMHLSGMTPAPYLRYAFESRVDNIMYGCLLAILVKTGRLKDLLTRITNAKYLPILLAAALAGSAWLEENIGLPFHYTVGMAVDSVLITLLLAQMIVLSGTPQWSWLDAAPLRFLGRISYSLYLYHFTAVGLVQYFLGGERLHAPASLSVTLALATASYLLVEQPFLRLKDRFAVEPAKSLKLAQASA